MFVQFVVDAGAAGVVEALEQLGIVAGAQRALAEDALEDVTFTGRRALRRPLLGGGHVLLGRPLEFRRILLQNIRVRHDLLDHGQVPGQVDALAAVRVLGVAAAAVVLLLLHVGRAQEALVAQVQLRLGHGLLRVK